MSRVVGAVAKLYTLPESTYGTVPTGGFTQLGFISVEMGTSQPLIDNPVLGVSPNRDPGDPFLDQVDTSGNAEIPLNLVGIGHWLRLLMGAPSTSGSTNFVHNFDSGAVAVPSNSFSIDYGAQVTNRYGVMSGVRASDISIDFSPAGAATARVGLIAQGEVRQATAVHGTPVLAAGLNFNKSMGSISRAGSALGQVVGGTLNFSNGLEAVRTIRADRRIEGADATICSASGTIRMRLSTAAETLNADAISNTPAVFNLRLERAATQYLDFRFGRVFLGQPKSPIRGPGGVEVEFPWRAAFDTSDGRMMRAALGNQTASYA